MWKDLTFQWQTVLEEAWTAFTNGSIPVGAAVFDKNGDLLVKDHNRRSEPQTLNPRTAHAELNVLQHIDCRGGLNIREIQLYTSMEPCPMCMGAIVMSNIKSLNCGSHDRWCGALHLLDTDPYMRSQHISVSEIPEETEFFQLVLSSYHELKHIRKEQPSRFRMLQTYQQQRRKTGRKALSKAHTSADVISGSSLFRGLRYDNEAQRRKSILTSEVLLCGKTYQFNGRLSSKKHGQPLQAAVFR